MSDTKQTEDLHIRISEELKSKVAKAAKKARRSLADYVRITLESATDGVN